MQYLSPHLGMAFMLVGLLAITGCAVKTAPSGKVSIGVDDAELFGQNLGSFKLMDGSEGRLRVINGRYSIKLQKYFKVIPIDKATRVRLLSAQVVDGRTLLVLEKSERNCRIKMQLMAIQGSEVLTWDFGDCQSQPVTTIHPDSATFDFVQPRRTTRYTYQGERLTRGDFDTQPGGPLGRPVPAAAPISASAPRFVPGLPAPARASVMPPPRNRPRRRSLHRPRS